MSTRQGARSSSGPASRDGRGVSGGRRTSPAQPRRRGTVLVTVGAAVLVLIVVGSIIAVKLTSSSATTLP